MTSGSAAVPRAPVRARLSLAAQRLLPQHALSRVVHRLTRSRVAPVKNALIGAFVRRFRPEMGDACESNPRRYESFNAFFTRALQPGARAIDREDGAVVSPVDGTVSQIGQMDGLTLLQAKGKSYRLDALLGGHREWIERLRGGAFATLYLAPHNYHRIHMPVAGDLRAAWYTPGRLFSVNEAATRAVSELFARNERIACAFETRDGLPFAMVLVGALFVGSMTTRWHGEVTPCRPRSARDLPVPSPLQRLEKGEEMGRFNMGSTVVLLFPRDSLAWLPQVMAGSPIRVGQRLARLGVVP